MGKLIAVWGAPNSGKTVFSVKLAEALYNRSRGKCAVIVVFADVVTPTLPVVFPNFRSEDVYSIGSVLSKPDFFADDVVSNAMPENVHDRPSKSYEHIFLLAKSAKYFYDDKAIAEPISPITVERYKRKVSHTNKYANDKSNQALFKGRANSLLMNQETRNKRDVWSVSTNAYRMKSHFAMFPEKLIEPCILAGSQPRDIVLDPFFGSGTTGAVAKRLGRKFIGIDLNREYCEAAEKRISEVA